MNFELIESDIFYPLYFQIIFGIQLLFLLFAVVYCIKLIFKIKKVKKTFHIFRTEIINENDIDIIDTKLIIQRKLIRLGSLNSIFDCLTFLGKKFNSNYLHLKIDSLLIKLSEDISRKNLWVFFILNISFLSSLFVTTYEIKKNVGFEINKVLGSFVNLIFPLLLVSSITIVATTLIYHLNKRLYMIIKKNTVDSAIYHLDREFGMKY